MIIDTIEKHSVIVPPIEPFTALYVSHMGEQIRDSNLTFFASRFCSARVETIIAPTGRSSTSITSIVGDGLNTVNDTI